LIENGIRDEDVIIIDLRSNMGGSASRGFRWLYELLGEAVPSISLTLISHIERDDFLFVDSGPPYDLDIFYGINHLNEHYFLFLNHPDRIIESGKTLIFLTDTNTASAAERFIGLSINMTNTLVIGRPTAGVAGFGGSDVSYLPNSGISFWIWLGDK